jgi:cob(I)alamin adenosyltransferase
MGSQVTTKRGDTGETRALSGEVYSKSHPIFAACGDVDAMRAGIAALRLKVCDCDNEQATEASEFLFWLLHICFLIGSECNDPLNKKPEYRNRDLSATHLKALEAFQAKVESQVELPKFFIVSASNELAAMTDILCTDVRRLERSIVVLKETLPGFDTTVLLPFINRLSDTIFMLARWFEHGDHTPVNYEVLD